MKELQIRSIIIKKFRCYSEKITSNKKENLLNREFKTTFIHQKWCMDTTYIYTKKDGWTYLDSFMDLHNKKLIGYAYDVFMITENTIKAVSNACLNIKDTEGILLHSDLRVQYTRIRLKNT